VEARERARFDPALGHDPAVEQDDRDSEVIEAEELRVRVDIAEGDLHPTSPEQLQSLLAQVAVLAGDQFDPHRREG